CQSYDSSLSAQLF
nr:immunoglobulin light chain junction region [Macaca mulatta]MPN65394.1 immunoglobulin light chain junction region [Macaca mulatta]MPN65471.1 immunoglobulin light chain junction region [Macaca mulatta]MPN65565.1 immunoglobulin light chain junction region [Macaca mulatta]MPN65574.1 immunoglobulin light chain junction region [Macaca mulatta]